MCSKVTFGAVLYILTSLQINGLLSESFYPRIVGGYPVPITQYPYQIALLSETGFFLCGGTIIDPSTIITAAHCIKKKKIRSNTFKIKVGKTSRCEDGEEYEVERIAIPKDYSPNSLVHDIAVLKLKKPLNFSDSVKAAKLPLLGSKMVEGMKGVVTGWGKKSQNSTGFPCHLREVEVPIWSHEMCRKALVHRKNPNAFCAGFVEGGKDACTQDSGGPYAINGTLYGIVSWGKGCANPNSPGIYTNVSKYLSYIKRIREAFKKNLPSEDILEFGNKL